MKRLVAGCLVLLTFVVAQPAWAQQPTRVEMSEADRTRFDGLRASGFEALFNLDYEKARQSFRELAQAFPDHPAGPQFLAAASGSRPCTRPDVCRPHFTALILSTCRMKIRPTLNRGTISHLDQGG